MKRTRSSIERKAALGAGALALVLLLAGCPRPPSLGPGEADFGNAVRHNIEAQLANPDAAPQQGSAPYDGERAARGVVRYKTDQVKEPRSMRTTPILGTSGGGQGGGQ